MPQELKPCPACNSKITTLEKREAGVFIVLCGNKDCGMQGPKRRTRGKAIAAWNSLPRDPHITPNDADCKGCPERRPPQPALVWTDEPPKVPGWYWHKENSGEIRMIGVGVDLSEYESLPGQWAGPIPMPEEMS